jgi:O-antigen/teichoic acid export membrane protein
MPIFGKVEDVNTRELVTFAIPVWGERLLETARAQLFPVLLGSLTALASSAVYVASGRIAVAPAAVITAMSAVFAPMGSNLFLQGRKAEYEVLFKSMAKWSFLLGFPAFALVVGFPREMLSLFGGTFRSATTALILLAVAMLFNVATGPVTVTLNQIGRPNLVVLNYALTVAAEVGLAVLLIPRYGLLGAAIAKVIGTAINNGLPVLQVWVVERIHPYTWDWWKPIAATGAAVAVARISVRVAGLGTGIRAGALAALVMGLVYPGLVLAFGLSDVDRAGLDALVRRFRRPLPRGAKSSSS